LTGFIRNKSAVLAERIQYNEIVSLLKSDNGVPLLIAGDLLDTFFDEATIEPEIKCLFLNIKFDADNSGCSCSELLSNLVLLIRYSNLYIIYN
jgi:hypothetical protein